MTNHYAIIDKNTGYIFGDTHANTPTMACAIIDSIISNDEYTYTEVDATDQSVTYIVYKISSGQFDLLWGNDGNQQYDGQDQDLIELLQNQTTIECYIARS